MNEPTPLPEPQSCARVRGRLIELLELDLDALAAARDEGHLEACAACRAERDQLASVFRVARALDQPSARELERARAGLSAYLSRAANKPRPHPLVRRLLPASAAAAAAVLALAALELGARHAQAWRAPSRSLGDPRTIELSAPAHWADGLRNLWNLED